MCLQYVVIFLPFLLQEKIRASINKDSDNSIEPFSALPKTGLAAEDVRTTLLKRVSAQG